MLSKFDLELKVRCRPVYGMVHAALKITSKVVPIITRSCCSSYGESQLVKTLIKLINDQFQCVWKNIFQHFKISISYSFSRRITKWASCKKGPYMKGIFDQFLNFYIFWMYMMLRFISENWSTLAVKISYLLYHKHGVNLLSLLWIWPLYVLLSDYLMLILKFYTLRICLQASKPL